MEYEESQLLVKLPPSTVETLLESVRYYHKHIVLAVLLLDETQLPPSLVGSVDLRTREPLPLPYCQKLIYATAQVLQPHHRLLHFSLDSSKVVVSRKSPYISVLVV